MFNEKLARAGNTASREQYTESHFGIHDVRLGRGPEHSIYATNKFDTLNTLHDKNGISKKIRAIQSIEGVTLNVFCALLAIRAGTLCVT